MHRTATVNKIVENDKNLHFFHTINYVWERENI